MCPCMWFGVFGTSFPKLPQYQSTCETGLAQPTEGLWRYSKVSFDVKLEAEDFGLFFMCPCTWFGVFRPSFPKLPQYLSTCETGIVRPTEGLNTSVRSHLMWNKELKTLNFFLCGSVVDFGVFWPFPQNFSNAQVPIKQV